MAEMTGAQNVDRATALQFWSGRWEAARIRLAPRCLSVGEGRDREDGDERYASTRRQ
jgi:hypothetical protein